MMSSFKYVLLAPICCFLYPVTVQAEAKAASAAHAKRLIGAWKVESVTFRVVDGPVLAEPFGPRPAGSIFFSANGRLGAQITRRDLKPFAVNDPQKGTPDEMVSAYRGNI